MEKHNYVGLVGGNISMFCNVVGWWKHNYVFVVQMLVGVGDLINDSQFCRFQDLVGVGDLKMPPV